MLIRSILAAVLLIVSCAPALAQNNGRDPVSTIASPFFVGERLVYEVSWADFIVAGELTFETKERRNVDGVDAFHVSAQAQSVGLVSAVVLKVNDVYESFIDATTRLPFRAEKQSRHGKKRRQGSVTFDQTKHTAALSDGRIIQVPPETYDMAGLLYAIRGMELTVGKPRMFTLLEDDKLHAIRVEPDAREKITTRAGTFDTVRLATRMRDRERSSNLYNLRLYITADLWRVPVLITAEPPWGRVRVSLTSATGTRPAAKR